MSLQQRQTDLKRLFYVKFYTEFSITKKLEGSMHVAQYQNSVH
jgi:hypothetical protein